MKGQLHHKDFETQTWCVDRDGMRVQVKLLNDTMAVIGMGKCLGYESAHTSDDTEVPAGVAEHVSFHLIKFP